MLFLHLTRLIGEEAHPVLINADHIVSMYTAVSFDHYGQPTFADSGTDIWTLLEATGNDNASPWRVTQSMDEILRLLPEDVVNVQRARRHLASLSPERRAQLEREWAEAEFHREPISADIRARANTEWEQSK